ncbi:hypothetical protein T484DRAFT_1813393, partial [Baffinella frigidus]
TGDGVCYYMGQLRTGKWSLLDPRHPGVGLKLTYTGGSECDGDTDRSTEFHFECNPEASNVPLVYPVSAAHTSTFRMDSNSTSYKLSDIVLRNPS